MNDHTPKGIRNNNPLNIKRNNIHWLGMSPTQTDPIMCQFIEMKWGVRAAFKSMKNSGMKTLGQLIEHWAPAGADANHTREYIAYVSREAGLVAWAPLDLDRYGQEVIKHMAAFENSGYQLDANDIAEGIEMAGHA